VPNEFICEPSRPHPHELVSIMITDRDGVSQTWRDICRYTLGNLDLLFARPEMAEYELRYTIIPRAEVTMGPRTFVMVNRDGTIPT
jgi:hypothetical protein